MVVEGGVHVEAVCSVGEAETKVRRLSPLHHFDHKIPDIVLSRNEQTDTENDKKSNGENVFYLLESATD